MDNTLQKKTSARRGGNRGQLMGVTLCGHLFLQPDLEAFGKVLAGFTVGAV